MGCQSKASAEAAYASTVELKSDALEPEFVAGKKVLRGELFRQNAKPLNSTDVGKATRASDFVDGLLSILEKEFGSPEKIIKVQRIVIVAGEEPEELPDAMQGLAHFIYIPGVDYGRALFPLVIPVRPSSDDNDDCYFPVRRL